MFSTNLYFSKLGLHIISDLTSFRERATEDRQAAAAAVLANAFLVHLGGNASWHRGEENSDQLTCQAHCLQRHRGGGCYERTTC